MFLLLHFLCMMQSTLVIVHSFVSSALYLLNFSLPDMFLCVLFPQTPLFFCIITFQLFMKFYHVFCYLRQYDI